MLLEEKMLKDKMSKFMADITDLTRDGESSIPINPPRKELQDITEPTDSISTEHSTSDQECQ
jgi:hypothetical protein